MHYTNIISTTAKKEIDDAYYYYSNENIAIGLHFITELEKLLLFIQSNPLAFRIVTKKIQSSTFKKISFLYLFCNSWQTHNYIICISSKKKTKE